MPQLSLGHLNNCRDDERFAVLAREESVGLFIVDEFFGFAVHFQERAESSLRHVEVDVVGGKMLFKACQSFERGRVGFERLADFILAGLFAQTIRDVRRVAEGAGEMPFENVGIQVGVFSAADGFDEVSEMILASSEGFYFFARFF